MTQKKRKKSPQKRITSGFEVEFFIINKESGAIEHRADDLVRRLAETSEKYSHAIVTESTKNLIEVGSYPDVDGANTMTNLIEGIKLLTYVADDLGLAVLPLGTYPGKFTPEIRKAPHYKVQEKLHGKSRFQITGRCAGYHCHHSLPWGVFDAKTKMLKRRVRSKNQESLVHSYNMAVALDPALTALMQSSPFYQGAYVAKDSRMVMYRGGDSIGMDVKGLYSDFPRLGALPSYEHSGTDIINSIERRFEERLLAYKKIGVADKDIPKYDSILTPNWTPVKVNPHGTLEQRGMDMNHLPLVLSVSVLMWRTLHYIQEEGYRVVTHDLAKDEPFALEGKTIYVAPDSHVRQALQKASATEGLASDDIFLYCRRLVALVKELDGPKIEWLLKPLDTMLDERRTTADKILAQARELGHTDLKKTLPQRIASEIAKTHSKQMFEDIVILQKMIEEHRTLLQ